MLREYWSTLVGLGEWQNTRQHFITALDHGGRPEPVCVCATHTNSQNGYFFDRRTALIYQICLQNESRSIFNSLFPQSKSFSHYLASFQISPGMLLWGPDWHVHSASTTLYTPDWRAIRPLCVCVCVCFRSVGISWLWLLRTRAAHILQWLPPNATQMPNKTIKPSTGRELTASCTRSAGPWSYPDHNNKSKKWP